MYVAGKERRPSSVYLPFYLGQASIMQITFGRALARRSLRSFQQAGGRLRCGCSQLPASLQLVSYQHSKATSDLYDQEEETKGPSSDANDDLANELAIDNSGILMSWSQPMNEGVKPPPEGYDRGKKVWKVDSSNASTSARTGNEFFMFVLTLLLDPLFPKLLIINRSFTIALYT